MRLDVLIPLFLSFPAGLLIFIIFSRDVQAHLRSFKERLSFFLWPFPPNRMLIVQELDGEVNIYYDDDFEEIKTENRTLIRTVDGQQYVTESPPSQAAVTVSMFDAKAPSGYYSPFAVAWRWVVAASILVYFVYYSLVVAWIPPIEIEKVFIAGRFLKVVKETSINPWEALFATTAFFSVLTWFISNVVRMDDRTILYAWYHAKGINPPQTSILPVPGLSSMSLIEYLEKLGREIKVIVPSELDEVVKKVAKKVGEKKGEGRTLAALILAKLSMSRVWRESLAQVLRERFDMRKAGEASAMIRLGIEPRKTIPLLLIVFIIGLIVGYGLGNAFSISVTPATTSPIQPPPQPYNVTTSPPYAPAKPPPPPGGG